MKSELIRISTLCLDLRTYNTFDIFLKTVCKKGYSLTENHEEAKITIIDFDAFEGESKLLEFQNKFPQRTVIILSILEKTYKEKNIHFIKKPLKHEELIKKLHELGEENHRESEKQIEIEKRTPRNTYQASLEANQKNSSSDRPPVSSADLTNAAIILEHEEEHHFVGTQKDIDLSITRNLLRVFYHPEKMFQGAIAHGYTLAKKNETCVEIITFGIGVLIDPKNYKAYTVVSDSVLRPICLLETEDKAVYKRINSSITGSESYTRKSKAGAELVEWDIDVFLWKISLWSSRGRIPKQTDLKSAVYLSHWPNLSRWELVPHALQISALMTKKPIRLSSVASQLDIPQRYVFSFYSACVCMGIAGVSKRQADNLFEDSIGENETETPKKQSLMGKILKRLTGKTIKSGRKQA